MFHDLRGGIYNHECFFVYVFLEKTKDHIEHEKEFYDLIEPYFHRVMRDSIGCVVCIDIHTINTDDSYNLIEVLFPFRVVFDYKSD